MTTQSDILSLDLDALRERCAALEAENVQLRELTQTQNSYQIRLEIAMRASKQGFWYWYADTDETYYSNEYYQILGYEPQEFTPSYAKWVEMLHPEDRERAIKAQRKFVKGETEEYDEEFRLLTKQQEYRWFLTKGGKLKKNDGAIVLVGLVIDVHEHKQAEIALEQEKAHLQLALEVADQGVWDWNLETGEYYHSANYFKLLGFEKGEIDPSYEYWVGSIHPDERDKLVNLEMDCIAGYLSEYQMEYRMRTKEGLYKWYLCATKVLRKDENGQALHMIGIIKDIDQRKKTEISLKESEEKFRLLIEWDLYS